MHQLAIFASGRGSNARKIIEYFKDHESIKTALVLTNRSDAMVLNVAQDFGVPTAIIDDKAVFQQGQIVEAILAKYHIDFVILAGFLWLIPLSLIKAFPNRIINIHPALLPKYGGKGMYGMHVHKAVRANNEPESGITIHYVNEHFDEGQHIFQAACSINPQDTAQDIAHAVQALEHQYYPSIIEALLLSAVPSS